MNKLFIRLYAFFCSLVIIATLIIFGVRVLNSSKANLVEAEKNFKYIARYIVTNANTLDLNDVAFLDRIRGLCELSGNIEMVSLVNARNVSVFEWVATGDEKKVFLDKATPILKPYAMSISLKTPSGNETVLYTFQAVLRTVSNASIALYLRDCLLVFATLFVCTLIFLIMHYLLTDSPKPAKLEVAKVPLSNLASPGDYIKPNLDTPSKTDFLVLEDDESGVVKREYTLDDLPDLDKPRSRPKTAVDGLVAEGPTLEPLAERMSELSQVCEATTSETSPSPETSGADLEETQVSSAAVGAVAPSTQALETQVAVLDETETEADEHKDFGSSEGLEERLAYELSRATSSEQDISLMIIRAERVSEECIRELRAILLKHFVVRDLIFQQEENTFAVILPDSDLELSMQSAETLYESLLYMLTREQIGIGITTRSARLVSAARLMDEAGTAVEKAFEHPDSPIVAFRPDPRAYREFIKDYT